MTHERREGRPDHAIAVCAGPQTEIHILIAARRRCVEWTCPHQAFPRYEHAGACDGRQRLTDQQTSHRTRKILVASGKPRSGRIVALGIPVKADDESGVLDSAVGVEELRADDADVGIIKATDHFFEPVRLQDFGVVAEQQDITSARRRDAAVDGARRTQLFAPGYDERHGPALALLIKRKHTRIPRAKIDDDNFEGRIVGARGDILENSGNPGKRVAIDQNDGDQRPIGLLEVEPDAMEIGRQSVIDDRKNVAMTVTLAERAPRILRRGLAKYCRIARPVMAPDVGGIRQMKNLTRRQSRRVA